MRDRFITLLYELSAKPYQKLKKAEPWKLTTAQLRAYPEGSLGRELGDFLLKNGFTPQDKLESHDVFHVLTGTGVRVIDEIGMQFYLLGNGKRSLYGFAVMLSGIVFFPEKITHFRERFRAGKTAFPFHHMDFRNLLRCPVSLIRNEYAICS